MIVYMLCADNNRAATIFDGFLGAVEEFGLFEQQSLYCRNLKEALVKDNL